MKKDSYKKAGVDIAAGEEAVEKIKKLAKATHADSVMANIGAFGSLFDLTKVQADYKEPVLVQSVDGVGTKTEIAKLLGQWDTVGMDIVNHSCNDILCQGAEPLTFLDYVATSKLDTEQMADIVKGMAEACQEVGLSLVGGETAEMPGVYGKGQWDIVGTIMGVVEKSEIIDGSQIKNGDMVIGLGSNGLHTNGYTLAREVLLKKYGKDKKVLEQLLRPHLNYTKPVLEILKDWPIKGIAHITGGGLKGNIARILPDDMDMEIDKGSWEMPEIFELIQKEGDIPEEDMYKAFNMGVGMVLVIAPEDEGNIENVLSKFPDFKFNWIGKISKGSKQVILK